MVVVEDTDSRESEVTVYRETPPGANIRPAGEDVKRGHLVLRKGAPIGPAQMGMLASLGMVDVMVKKRPTAAIITTGDELVDASERPGPGQIRNGNQYSLLGEAMQAGAQVSVLARARDDKGEIERALSSAAACCDVVIICGGVSVGDYDYVKEVIARLGEIKFWKVAIKPGKPFVFAEIGGKPVFGLPGNPVSCMVTFELFVRPAILRMMGADPAGKAVSGAVTEDVPHRPGAREFIRAVTSWTGGGYSIAPIQRRGSGRLSSMVEANSYLVVPEDTGDLRPGDQAEVILREGLIGF